MTQKTPHPEDAPRKATSSRRGEYSDIGLVAIGSAGRYFLQELEAHPLMRSLQTVLVDAYRPRQRKQDKDAYLPLAPVLLAGEGAGIPWRPFNLPESRQLWCNVRSVLKDTRFVIVVSSADDKEAEEIAPGIARMSVAIRKPTLAYSVIPHSASHPDHRKRAVISLSNMLRCASSVMPIYAQKPVGKGNRPQKMPFIMHEAARELIPAIQGMNDLLQDKHLAPNGEERLRTSLVKDYITSIYGGLAPNGKFTPELIQLLYERSDLQPTASSIVATVAYGDGEPKYLARHLRSMLEQLHPDARIGVLQTARPSLGSDMRITVLASGKPASAGDIVYNPW